MVQLFLHALVQIAAVGHDHVIAVTLPVKHRDEGLALLAGLVLAGLEHAIALAHLAVDLAHLQEIVDEMVKDIPSSVPFHAILVPSTHLGHHVEDQT